MTLVSDTTSTVAPTTIHKVLVVDDHEIFLRTLVRDFTRQGVQTFQAATGEAALKLLDDEHPELVIVDLFLTPPDNGLKLIADIKAAQPSIFCILVSAHMSVAHAVLGVRAGADDVFLKPFAAKQALQRATGGPATPDMSIPTLDQIEWEHIARVLGDYDGNITHAAEALGVLRQSLQRKIQKHAPRVMRPGELPQTTRKRRRRPRPSG